MHLVREWEELICLGNVNKVFKVISVDGKKQEREGKCDEKGKESKYVKDEINERLYVWERRKRVNEVEQMDKHNK